MMLDGYIAEYLRISDDDEDIGESKKESASISNQRNILQYFISHHEELSKYPVKEFLDDGFSGVNFNRPGIQNLLAEVRKKKVCCIVVKDLSRFGRNYLEVGDYIEQIFPFMGVRFISVSDNYDSFIDAGGLEIGFKNLIHDLYSRDLSKKIKSVKQMHQKRGEYSGGDVPYGYRRIAGEKGAYHPDPVAAEIVRMIFSLAVKGNEPSHIAKLLNEQGICTPGVYKNQMMKQNYCMKNQKSNLWTPAQVREIIQNEVYIGTFICCKSSTVRPKEIQRNDKEDYIKHVNDHDELITRDEFDAAQLVIQRRGKRGKYRKDHNSYVLKGKVKCGCCGYGMSRSGKEESRVFYCRMGASCGSNLRIAEKVLEQTVLNLINQLASVCLEHEKKQRNENIRRLTELSEVREKKRVIEMKLEHSRSNRLLIYRQWKEGKLEKAEYVSLHDEFIRQEAELQSQHEEIVNLVERLSVVEPENTWESELCYNNGIKELSRELIDKLIEKIEVYGEDRIEVVWKFKNEYEHT